MSMNTSCWDATPTWCAVPTCPVVADNCCKNEAEDKPIAVRKKFADVTSGLQDYINRKVHASNRKVERAVVRDVRNSKEFKSLWDLYQKETTLSTEFYELSGWFTGKRRKEINTERKNIRNQFDESLTRNYPGVGGLNYPMSYALQLIVDHTRATMDSTSTLSYDEVRAKLHTIKDWEDKTFAELVEMIADKPETNEEVIAGI